MASVNTKNGKPFTGFRWRGKRGRKYTAFQDILANRTRLEKVVRKIERDIKAGKLDDARYFLDSLISHKVSSLHSQDAPTRGWPEPATLPSGGGCPDVGSARLELLFNTRRRDMEPVWRRTYGNRIEQAFRVDLLPFFAKEKGVGDITKEDILAFRASLAKGRPERKQNLSPAIVNRNLKVLPLMVDEAADRFQCKSPLTGVKLLKERRILVDPWTLDRVPVILKHVRKNFQPCLTLRRFVGMGTGGVHELKWKCEAVDRRESLIREAFVGGATAYTKNDGPQREIAMSEAVHQAREAQKSAMGQFEWVCPNTLGVPNDDRSLVRYVCNPLLRNLGFLYRRPYQARHTAAALWLAAGGSPRRISRQMGHSSTEMLFRGYSRYVSNLTRRDGSACERMLAQTKSPTEAFEQSMCVAVMEVNDAS